MFKFKYLYEFACQTQTLALLLKHQFQLMEFIYTFMSGNIKSVLQVY